MDIKQLTLVLILLSTFICGCKKKTDPAATPGSAISSIDYLSSSIYQKLEVQIVYDKGYPPSPETIASIKTFLESKINKPAGITITQKEIQGPSTSRITLENLRNIESLNRSFISNGGTLSMFIYLTNAEYEEPQSDYKTLGVQYGPGGIALFGKSLHNSAGGIGQPSYHVLESSVVLHELGHVVGLVNTGTKMVTAHMDAAHGHHCNNKECLMYFAVETSDIVSNILGGTVPPLDVNCNNDLKANGGK
ncbi:MAG: hypothetical protein H0W61_03615 [Bacteroidetes bacterium]|nr:hypothetical protein [Bacteroidota bacterium]